MWLTSVPSFGTFYQLIIFDNYDPINSSNLISDIVWIGIPLNWDSSVLNTVQRLTRLSTWNLWEGKITKLKQQQHHQPYQWHNRWSSPHLIGQLNTASTYLSCRELMYSAARLNGKHLSSHFWTVKPGWPFIRANFMSIGHLVSEKIG